MSFDAIHFSHRAVFDDPEPTRLDPEGYRAVPFMTKTYAISANYRGDGVWTFNAYRSGLILKQNGEPRIDGRRASVVVKIEDVPRSVVEQYQATMEARQAALHDDAMSLMQAVGAM